MVSSSTALGALGLVALALAGCGAQSPAPSTTFPSVTSVGSIIHRTVPHTVGVQVAVEKDGKVVLDHGYGDADVAAKKAVGTDTRFGIGSVTKQVTAALVLQQVSAGKLTLDEPLAKALPGITWPQGITVEQVLQQTSGLGDDLPPPDVVAQGRPAIDRFIAALPTKAGAGARWNYDNDNYLVAGDEVEKATGGTYLDAASAVLPGGGACDGEATSYDAKEGAPKQVEPIGYPVSFAAGGLCSTAKDLLTWQDSLRTGAFGSDTYATMTEVSDQSQEHGSPYGMGLYVGPDLVWHDGFVDSDDDPAGGQTAYLAWLPKEKVGVAVLANTAGDGTGDARAIGEALVAKLR